MAVCKAIGPDESVVDDSYCDPDNRPEKTLMPCNTHPCTAKWVLSWRLACVHASKNVRPWIFDIEADNVIFYSTNENAPFWQIVRRFLRPGSRSLQKSSSIEGNVDPRCLDFYSFLFHCHRWEKESIWYIFIREIDDFFRWPRFETLMIQSFIVIVS